MKQNNPSRSDCPLFPVYMNDIGNIVDYPIQDVGPMPWGCWKQDYRPIDLGGDLEMGVQDIGCCDMASDSLKVNQLTSFALMLTIYLLTALGSSYKSDSSVSLSVILNFSTYAAGICGSARLAE